MRYWITRLDGTEHEVSKLDFMLHEAWTFITLSGLAVAAIGMLVVVLGIALTLALPTLASAQTYFVTPNGTVVDWYGNVISTVVKVAMPKKISPVATCKPSGSVLSALLCKYALQAQTPVLK